MSKLNKRTNDNVKRTNSTFLFQKEGGKVIKQNDVSSNFAYELQDEYKKPITTLDKSEATVLLVNDDTNEVAYQTTVEVDKATIEFVISDTLGVGVYNLEVHCQGYVFPSNNDIQIEVVQSAKKLEKKEEHKTEAESEKPALSFNITDEQSEKIKGLLQKSNMLDTIDDLIVPCNITAGVRVAEEKIKLLQKIVENKLTDSDVSDFIVELEKAITLAELDWTEYAKIHERFNKLDMSDMPENSIYVVNDTKLELLRARYIDDQSDVDYWINEHNKLLDMVTKDVVEDIELPFTTETINDDTLYIGQEEVAQEGVKGLKQVIFKGGNFVSEEVIREPKNKIVRVGTKLYEHTLYANLSFNNEIQADFSDLGSAEMAIERLADSTIFTPKQQIDASVVYSAPGFTEKDYLLVIKARKTTGVPTELRVGCENVQQKLFVDDLSSEFVEYQYLLKNIQGQYWHLRCSAPVEVSSLAFKEVTVSDLSQQDSSQNYVGVRQSDKNDTSLKFNDYKWSKRAE